MYINHIASYIPSKKIPNTYFGEINGLSDEWILERTGIKERRKAGEQENTQTMAMEAVAKGLENLPFEKDEIDLIVGGTYTPHDTIYTLAHAVQKQLNINDIPVISISTACSTFVNAMEIVEGYFALNKASKALVVLSEHNTQYSKDADQKAGHLWGDGAAAVFVSKEKIGALDFKVTQIITGGAGNIGKANESVYLRPATEGFEMPFGRDVFINACQYMSKITRRILEENDYTIDDLSYLIPHQANLRITKNVAESLNLNGSKALSNIQYLGNTGCAGAAIAIDENIDKFKKGDVVVVTVFGGGYSYGAMLLENN